ncbi:MULTISPECIES: hypothetical protein [Mesorhizobium]|uniref:DUF1134 domain-containing protein n=1 Tax=Mesorhizobium neociceri TaxID=1307853 RepID=A0A838BB36_9HYPH|nr:MULTISPECIES: hypothetical protein [Mesorhizobium]MBA1143121.1 hypothetical protein [Mesorhizobium neociceri]
MKRRGLMFLTLLSLVGLSFAATEERTQGAADATMRFLGDSAAAGAGYTWGGGTLDFEGKCYPFTVSGLTFIDIGAERIDGAGTVYNLKTAEDLAGTYIAAGSGATLAGGGSVVALENQNGVIVHFHSTTAGLKLYLSPAGIVVKLK